MAVRIAPATPPPATCPTSAPTSMLLAAPASTGMSAVSICPPTPPPMAPTTELRTGPRSTDFPPADPTTLPPMMPAMTWTIRLISTPDIGTSLAEDQVKGYHSAFYHANRRTDLVLCAAPEAGLDQRRDGFPLHPSPPSRCCARLKSAGFPRPPGAEPSGPCGWK